MTMGERIKTVRGDASRDRLAAQMGVSKSTIVNYETDMRDPPAAFLQKVLELHPHISPGWLLTGEGPMDKRDAFFHGAAAKVDDDLLQLVIETIEEHLDKMHKRLPPTKKAQLVTLVYEMHAEEKERTVDKAKILTLVKLAA